MVMVAPEFNWVGVLVKIVTPSLVMLVIDKISRGSGSKALTNTLLPADKIWDSWAKKKLGGMVGRSLMPRIVMVAVWATVPPLPSSIV